MHRFNPRSYVSEVVAAKAKDADAASSFSPSYEDFVMGRIAKKEKSITITEALGEEAQHLSSHIQQLCGQDVTFTCPTEKTQSVQKTVSQLVAAEASLSRRMVMCAAEINEFITTLAEECWPDHDDSLPRADAAEQTSLLVAVCEHLADKVEDLLVECGCCSFAFPGRPWNVGVRGAGDDDDVVFVRYLSLSHQYGPCAMISLPSASFQDTVSLRGTFFGADLRKLCCATQLASQCNSYKYLLQLLRKLSQKSDFFTDFYCDGNDGFELSFNEVTEEKDSTSATHLWNMQQHFLETVRCGNTADALHVLETRHDGALFTACKRFEGMVSSCGAKLAVVATNGAIIEENVHQFQLLNRSRDFACVSIGQNSPSFNHIANRGDCAAVTFVTTGGEASFTVRELFLIGEGALVFGFVQNAKNHQIPATQMTPFVATLLHRTYGLVGVSGFGVSLASNFPPCLALAMQYHYADFPLEECAIDPNVEIFFFNSEQTVLANKTPEDLYERLPIQLGGKDALPESQIAVKIRGRLVRIVPSEASNSLVMLVAVAAISFHSDAIWSHSA